MIHSLHLRDLRTAALASSSLGEAPNADVLHLFSTQVVAQLHAGYSSILSGSQLISSVVQSRHSSHCVPRATVCRAAAKPAPSLGPQGTVEPVSPVSVVGQSTVTRPGPWPSAARSVSGDVQAGLRGAVSMATGLTQPGVAVPVTSAAELSWPLPPFPAFTLLRERGGRRKGFPVSAVTWCVFSRNQQAEFSSPVC